MKLLKFLIPTLVLSALGFVACERIEPKPEKSVGLQASGYFAQKPANLLVRGTPDGLVVEVREKDKDLILGSGFIADEGIDAFISEVKGPMISVLSSTTLHVSQSGKVHKALLQVTGSATKSSSTAELDIEGTRWIQYNTGLLEHGVEGRVRFTIKAPDGKELGRFDGLTTRQSAGSERLAVGVNVPGMVTGDTALGGGVLGTGLAARLYMALPNGAGAVEVYGGKQVFNFDPATDLSEAEGNIGLIADRPDYLELTDAFRGKLKLGNVDIGDGGKATSHGDFNYSINVAVTPDKILVTGQGAANAFLTSSEGKKAEFHGANEKIQTELDW